MGRAGGAGALQAGAARLKDLPEDKAFYSSETRQELLLLLPIKDDVVMETVDPAFIHWLPGR